MSHGVYFIKTKLGRKVSFKPKKRGRITVNSYFNSSETNHLNTYNSYDVIVNSNLPCINAHTKSLLKNSLLCKNKLIHSQLLVSMMK